MTVVWEEYETGLPSVTDGDLDFVEARRRVSLPKGYRETVKQHVGDAPLPETVTVGRGRTPVCGLFFARYDFPGEQNDLNLWYWIDAIHDNYDADTAKKMIPFTSNGAQGIFAFDYRRGSEPAVVFLDLEGFADEGDASIYPVADSWDGFLHALKDCAD
ncbi:MAG: SMI1/KNR4 family protein [Propioniciclava sp.]